MIDYSFVPLHTVSCEIAPNVARHYDEIKTPDDYGPPDMDWETYNAASRAGYAVAVVARHEGVMVGYACFTIGYNPRYKTVLEANSAGVFVEKEFRAEAGEEIVQRADDYLKGIGVKETNYMGNDEVFGRLLRKNGYAQNYKVWSKKYGQ